MRRPLWAALATAVTLRVAFATLLAASRLEACVDGGGGRQSCANRFFVTLSVQGSENASESVTGVTVRSAIDGNGAVYDVLETLEVTLAKSRVRLRYPLTFTRLYNAAPREVVRLTDGGGRPFNFLTNPCVDDAASDGACGWVYAGGARVPSSQGFCCRCSPTDYLTSAREPSRANLQCDLFSSSNAQSAHCLRMGPLWYSAYALAAPRVEYTIDVVVRRCSGSPGGGSGAGAAAGGGECSLQLVSLSPASPGACHEFSPLVRGVAANASDPPPTNCGLWASLEGDFAAFEGAPELGSKLLMVPQLCDDYAACGNRTTEGADRWLLVDAFRAGDGRECDTAGVAYSAFNGQGERCAQPVGSCLHGQLEELYAADAAAEARGAPTTSFVRGLRLALGGGAGELLPSLASAATARLVLGTNRYQRSVVTLSLDADALRYTQRVATPVITSAVARPFEAMSSGGALSVALANAGAAGGLATVAVACSEGLEPVAAQQVGLQPAGAPGAVAVLSFGLRTVSTAGGAHECVVTASNALFRVTSSVTVGVNTTATVVSAGEQGGSPGPGAPTVGQSPAPAALPCEQRCPDAWDPVCALTQMCLRRIVGWAGGALGGVAALLLLAKFPSLLTVPARLVGGVCGGAAARCLGCGGRRGWGGGGGGAEAKEPRRREQARRASRESRSRGARREARNDDDDAAGGGAAGQDGDGETPRRARRGSTEALLSAALGAMTQLVAAMATQQASPGPRPSAPPAAPPPPSHTPPRATRPPTVDELGEPALINPFYGHAAGAAPARRSRGVGVPGPGDPGAC